jgi:hypothetical protein
MECRVVESPSWFPTRARGESLKPSEEFACWLPALGPQLYSGFIYSYNQLTRNQTCWIVCWSYFDRLDTKSLCYPSLHRCRLESNVLFAVETCGRELELAQRAWKYISPLYNLIICLHILLDHDKIVVCRIIRLDILNLTVILLRRRIYDFLKLRPKLFFSRNK